MIALSIGNGGWVRVSDDVLPLLIYVRFEAQAGDRLVPREIYLDGSSAGSPAIGAADIERVASTIDETEAWVNLDSEVREFLHRACSVVTPVDLSTMATYYSTTFGRQADPTRDWVAQAYAVAKGDERFKRPKRKLSKASRRPDYRLAERPGRRLDDGFLDRLATAYGSALARGSRKPAVEIAEDVSAAVGGPVSERTVQGWIAQARKRGFLTPGEQGRIG